MQNDQLFISTTVGKKKALINLPDWHYILNILIHAAVAEGSLPSGTIVKELHSPNVQVVAPVQTSETGNKKKMSQLCTSKVYPQGK